ncbi:MAG: hypothetical protein MI863_22130 [Desulfobacterales bacterium]|nr:hypothetical protein [Desulfobacterales bacterium]
MAVKKIDDCLSTRNGHLFIEEIDTTRIAEKYGTPVFVISEKQLRSNIRRFQKGFESAWADGPVKIMPAAKANWVTAIQKIIASEGCGCDTYSAGELTVALKSGIDPQFISVNGVPKHKDHIFNTVKQGARVTIDGTEEFDMIESAARELNVTAKVRLRLKPAISGFTRYTDFVPTGPLSTDLAALAYKGGLSREEVIAVGKRVMASDRVELVGFHEHHGRHNASIRYWEEQMKAYAGEIGVVCRELDNYQPGEISIGGGFAVPRDPFGSEIRFSEPYEYLALHMLSKALSPFPGLRYSLISKILEKAMVFRPKGKTAPSIEKYAAACGKTLAKHLPEHGINIKGLMLQVEPGRSLHGNTAIHLTRVMSFKRMTSPIRWNHTALDTTEFWFTGGRYEHHVFDYIFANRTDQKLADKSDVVGRSCYGDRLFPAIMVPRNLQPGDIMAMLDVGAYQEVSMSNFNAMPRPATLLVNQNRVSVIRRAETQDDVFKRDMIPDYLADAG